MTNNNNKTNFNDKKDLNTNTHNDKKLTTNNAPVQNQSNDKKTTVIKINTQTNENPSTGKTEGEKPKKNKLDALFK